MQTTDFDIVFKSLPKIQNLFLGAFALDLVPQNLKPLDSLIFNLDTSDKKGSHWLALICTEPQKYEIFDSLGTSVEKLARLLNISPEQIICNENSVQLENTNSCGLFGSYFLIHRYMNFDISMSDLISEIFDTNKNYNEYLVADFFKSL